MKSSKLGTASLIFVLGIALNFGIYYYDSHGIKSSVGSVLGRSYPLQTADIHAGDGGTIVVDGVSAIISEDTYRGDVYLRVDRTSRGNPVSSSGLWQISDMWNVRMRYMANDDEVSTIETDKNFILSFPYTQDYLTTDQGVRFDENYLKLLRGDTASGPWEVLENSVVDTVNRKVSVVTNRGGYFTIAGGQYNAPKPTRALQKETLTTERTVVLKENEVVVTITPQITDEVTQDEKQEVQDTSDDESAPSIGGSDVRDDNFFTAIWSIFQSIFD